MNARTNALLGLSADPYADQPWLGTDYYADEPWLGHDSNSASSGSGGGGNVLDTAKDLWAIFAPAAQDLLKDGTGGRGIVLPSTGSGYIPPKAEAGMSTTAKVGIGLAAAGAVTTALYFILK